MRNKDDLHLPVWASQRNGRYSAATFARICRQEKRNMFAMEEPKRGNTFIVEKLHCKPQ